MEGAPRSTDDPAVSQLVKQLSEQVSALARKEVELARAEMTAKGKRLGIGAGAFGGAGFLAYFAFGVFTAAVVLLLATAMDAWVAALIVAVAYAAGAGVLALIGKSKVEEGTPPVPEEAIESTKADVAETKHRVQAARQ